MSKEIRPVCHVKELEIGMEFSIDEGTNWLIVRTLPIHTQEIIINNNCDCDCKEDEINFVEFMASPKDKLENSEWKKISIRHRYFDGFVIVNREWTIQHMNSVKYSDFIQNATSDIPSAKNAYNDALNSKKIKALNEVGFEVENKIKNVVTPAINNRIFHGFTSVCIDGFFKDGTCTYVAEACVLEFLVEKGYTLMRNGFDLKINW